MLYYQEIDIFYLKNVHFFTNGLIAIEWALELPVRPKAVKTHVKGILFSCLGACLIAKKVGNELCLSFFHPLFIPRLKTM
jgi:hypothetical protein